MSDLAAGPPELTCLTLDNGLRVVHQQVAGAPRIAVCSHHGVGFRYESPAKEGFAHLFEHLMFQGSARVPQGGHHEAAMRSAGYVNGSTHQDYTDFQFVVSDWDLERVVFFEADRLRAPRFTREALKEQIELVQREIHGQTALRPYAGFPWPKTSQLLFDSYPNAHDGYGDMNQLCGVSLDECAEFFLDWYTPDNTVLTVVGDIGLDRVRALADTHLAALTARSTAVAPALDEGPLQEERYVEYVDPRVPLPGVSISWRLDGPEEGLQQYLAYVVLAHLLKAAGQREHVLPSLDADVGYFGPFDALTPEVFNVVVKAPLVGGSELAVDTVDAMLRRYACEDEVARVLDPVLVAARRRFDSLASDLLERARFVGKSLLLFSRPGLLDELPQAIRRVSATDVGRAARTLLDRRRAVVVVSPTQASGSAVDLVSQHVERVRTPEGQDAAARALVQTSETVPSLSPVTPAPPDLERLLTFDTFVAAGVPVVQGTSGLGSHVELRLTFSLGTVGWRYPWQVMDLVATLRRLAQAESADLTARFDLEIHCDGEHVTFAGRCEPDAAVAWSGAVRRIVEAAATPLAAGPPVQGERSLSLLADSVARRLLLGEEPVPAGPEPGSPAWTAWLGSHLFLRKQPSLVVVGRMDREQVAAVASSLGLVGDPGVPVIRPRTLPVTPRSERLAVPGNIVVVHRYTVEESDHGLSEAARYLATGVFGAGPHSRLEDARILRDGWDPDGHVVRRGVLTDVLCAMTTVQGTPEAVEAAERGLARALSTLRSRPLTSAEIRQVTLYCASELLNVFLKPASQADFLTLLVQRGIDTARYSSLARDLRAVTAEEVQEALAFMNAQPLLTIAVGNVPVGDSPVWPMRSAQ